jgi:glucose-1-phosphate cytidylyltransferase
MADQIPVLILCGGYGTRLREETDYRPKPMVEVGGRPMLWHIMKIYASHGFTRFILLTGYKGHVIKDYFLNYEALHRDFTVTLGQPDSIEYHGEHADDGWQVTVLDTGLDTMTGARIKQAERYVTGKQFMVTYGDGVADINLAALLDHHTREGRLATVTGVRPPARFGELIVDGSRVVEFSEKPQIQQGLINGGFFVFERQVFDYLSADSSCVLEKEPLERLATGGQLALYQHDTFWRCMDTYRDLQALNQLWDQRMAPWHTW